MDAWTNQLILACISLTALLASFLTYCLCKLVCSDPLNRQEPFPREAFVVTYPLGGVLEHLNQTSFNQQHYQLIDSNQQSDCGQTPPPTYQSLFGLESEKVHTDTELKKHDLGGEKGMQI